MTPVDGFDRRRAFCARLKNERERRGTSLADIAEATKIKASLLEALERGDVSRWPKGIYRRAFFRDYAAAIGFPADALVGEFLDVFGEREAAPAPSPAPATAGPHTAPVVPPQADAQPSFRITFAGAAGTRRAVAPGVPPAVGLRLRAALVDIAVVALLAWLVVYLTATAFAVAALLIALPYHLLSAAVGGSAAERLALSVVGRVTGRSSSPKPMPTLGSMPYGSPQQVASTVTFRDRAGDAFRRLAGLRVYLDRLAELRSMTFDRQRQRDLASMRRRRAEAANRASADEIPA